MRSTTKKVGTLLAATTGALFLTFVEAPQANAANLILSPGAYTVNTTTLKLTGPSVNVTGTNVGGVAVFKFGTISVPNGVTITATGKRPLELLSTNSLLLGGTIDASGVSATDFIAGPNAGGPGGGAGGADFAHAGVGPGGGGHGSLFTDGAGGGGFGGRGARGGIQAATLGIGGKGGLKNGNLNLALQGGSGGGGAATGGSGVGGGGSGGAVALVGASVTLSSSAVVVANGGGGAVGGGGGSGGGSGGGVVVHGNSISLDGVIVVAGGAGGAGGCCGDGGGGAGGRIAIQSKSLTSHATLVLVVNGGSSGTRSTSGCCGHGGLSPDATGASGLITFANIDPSKLTIGASKTVKKGTTVTVATRLTDRANGKPIAHDKVSLYKRTSKSGPFTKVITKTTSSKGKAKVLLVVKKFTQFQWRYAGGWVHDRATSAKQSIHIG